MVLLLLLNRGTSVEAGEDCLGRTLTNYQPLYQQGYFREPKTSRKRLNFRTMEMGWDSGKLTSQALLAIGIGLETVFGEKQYQNC